MIEQDDLFTLAPPVAPEVSEDSLMRQIDAMPYEEMLGMVRNAPLTHRLFRGKVGIHFHAVLKEKRHALSAEDRTAISARVGY